MIPEQFDNGFIIPPGEKFVAADELISFKCDSGFVLEGESFVECQGDGKWDVKFPVCVGNTYIQYFIYNSVDRAGIIRFIKMVTSSS